MLWYHTVWIHLSHRMAAEHCRRTKAVPGWYFSLSCLIKRMKRVRRAVVPARRQFCGGRAAYFAAYKAGQCTFCTTAVLLYYLHTYRVHTYVYTEYCTRYGMFSVLRIYIVYIIIYLVEVLRTYLISSTPYQVIMTPAVYSLQGSLPQYSSSVYSRNSVTIAVGT